MKLTGMIGKLAGAAVALLGSATLWADSVVVFNEIMYHPRTNEPALEWVELHNQLSVDVDISQWVIKNGIEYQFPEGTVIRGGGYLVVAVSPADLAAASGITNVLGPFTGRLANGGETIELLNNNNRLMDEVNYGVEGQWPVAPDGAGPSLAKREPDTASALAANWQASEQIGGTPGARNFPANKITVATTNLVALNSTWTYFNGDAGAAWRQPGFDDTAWASGAALFAANATLPSETASIPTLFNTGLDTNGAAVSPGLPDGNYFLTASAYSTPPPPAIAATVTANHPNWLANDASSRWIGPISQGTANVPQGGYTFRTTFNLTGFDHTTALISFQVAVDNDLINVALNGVQRGTAYSGFTAYSSLFTYSSGFVAGTNTLDFLTSNSGTAASPAGLRVKASGTARKRYVTNSTLTPGLATHCFRRAFVFTGAAANTRLLLRAVADDGAVFYLNGAEIHRLNLPAGPITPATPATVSISNANFTAWLDLPAGSLVSGTNVLAVEVHQADDGENDVLFGAEALLTVTNYPAPPSPALAFNEMSSVTNTQFWVEIVNYGATSLVLDNHVLARFGKTNLDYQLPARTLSPGECLVLDRATVGFGADPGDQVILYAPDKTNVLDAVVAKSFARARFPDRSGPWLRPSELTPGASNRFTFHDEVVINEIMYHPPDLPAVPALYFTNQLLIMTNAWRYSQAGTLPAADWFAPGYNDSLWPTGKAVFFANISTLPAPRGTQLAISNGPTPIIAYYFRTPFIFTNEPAGVTLTLNMVINDGAIFYLNGTEIYRYGMAEGEVTDSTLAITNIGIPAVTGPILLPATGLIAGTNVLAVEVHQYLPPPGSRTIAFALEATATGYVSPPVPARPSTESWVELYNRSTNTVDLTGWRLDNGADYSFAPGQTIPPGGYLVVAYDADSLRSNYAGIAVVGPLTKPLSRGGGLIELKDAVGNTADEIQYFDSSPWPDNADGFGGSLELRDPRADNAQSAAWAASNESGKSSWQTVTYRGVATTEPAASPTYWKEFVMGMLGAGELWLDDLSVIEAPSGARRQLIQNGSFETGLTAWRIIGTHRLSEVITDPANPGNHVLRLVSTGDTEHMHNHAETTLANGASITNGVEYEISYRVKWVAGCNKLNTRLYFNRLARTTELAMPATHGTPGTRNSVYVPNLGPTFTGLGHFPIVPAATEPVTISVATADPDGVAAATLRYSVNGGTWQSAPMTLTAMGATLRATGTIPAQAAASVVQLYVQATDNLGAGSTCPDGGTNSRALYKVSDGQGLMAGLRPIRLIMTPADTILLHAATNVMSNERFGCTVIADDERVYYGALMHLQGSERGRNASSRVGFTVRLPADNLLRGVHDGFTLDRSGGYSGLGGTHDEILLWHAINKAGGLPGMYDDLCQVFAPRNSEDGTGYLRLAKYGDVFLDSQYKNGGDGELFKLELIYYPTNTVVPGDPQSLKVPNPDLVVGTDIGNLGDDPENYRWTFLKENRVARDNYAPMVGLAKTFSLTGANLDQETRRLMDVDEWLRAVALLSLVGADDMYTYGNSHNLIIYFRPEDGRGMAFLWDLDYSLVANLTKAFPGNGSANTYKIITTIPDNYRRYSHHLYDLSNVTGDAAYMNQWANRYAGLLGQNWSGAVNYLVQRAAFVRATLPQATAFAVTNNGGGGFATTNNWITLAGTAPISVRDIEINGLRPAIVWTNLTTWTLAIPLPAYTNLLVIKALDSAGHVITNGTTSLTVTNLGQPPLLPVVINEWMADNGGPGGFPDPADAQFQDWFEMYNPNNAPVDLSGYYLTDTLLLPDKWAIPTNTVIAPRGLLLVWADENGLQNGTGTNGDLHANFKLSNGGESIGLFAPDGTVQHAVTFGAQFQNVSQGLFPDGNTNQFFFMTNWTPRATNQLGLPPAPALAGPVLLAGGAVTFVLPAEPNRAYRIDYKEFLDTSPWVPFQTNRAVNGVILFTDDANSRRQRFYRAVLLP